MVLPTLNLSNSKVVQMFDLLIMIRACWVVQLYLGDLLLVRDDGL